MNNDQISPFQVKIDSQNSNWTTPRSYGVWELPAGSNGKKFRFGNNPVREKELNVEFGSTKLVALYLSRISALEHAKRLN